ncbi:methylenetetrahydrofolate reductase [Pseudomonas aeruginosa]
MSQSERRFSFEFFPAKTEAGHEKLLATARNLAGYKPDFFSCTYGAGGSTRDRTLSTVLQLEAYGDDSRSIQAFGEQVISEMCERLLEGGAPGLHFYTLNQADPSLAIWKNLQLPR